MIDADLIIRCQKGDRDAFGALYSVAYKKAVHTVFLLAGNTDKTEDIIQDTFFECFRDIGKLRKPELFQAWFNRILVRKCQRYAWKRLPEHSLECFEEIQSDSNGSVDDIVERNLDILLVRKALNKLKLPLRTTIILFYYNGLSIKEIAGVMNCFQGTVKSRLHNARRILEKELCFEVTGVKHDLALMPERGSICEQ